MPDDMLTDLPHDLTGDQLLLLRTIAGPFLERGIWPTWDYVQRFLDGRDADAETTLRALPKVGANNRTYGFVQPFSLGLSGLDRIRLTIAASRVLPEFAMVVGEPFVAAMPHLINAYLSARPDPDGAAKPTMTSEELLRAVPRMKGALLDEFVKFAHSEPGLNIDGSSTAADGTTWSFGLTRTVLRFRGVGTVEEYVTKQCAFAAEWAAETLPAAPFPRRDTELAVEPYIEPGLLEDLEEAGAGTQWNLDKLMGLTRELNAAVAARHPYTCQALIRAILDNVPPAFGQKTFGGVVSSHSWSTDADKSRAKLLAENRFTANDAMHRQMNNDRSLIGMGDVPPRAQLQAVLRELLLVLRLTTTPRPGAATK
ncbi:hypothetical protein [Streptomyces avicenniae]|uniref:hypothetical protein n=1 Tax=Streptomyces avicenniae TaxID=500153 RepID=UPI00069A16BF|nr:hypothetical protein [Streptomyces avicenniae]